MPCAPVCVNWRRGLRLVDDGLFQETRTLGWGFAPLREMIRPWMPDAHDGVPSMFFDPRNSPSDMEEIARRLGTRLDIAALQVIEPSLLPKTVEVDCVAAFALGLRKGLRQRGGDLRCPPLG